MANEFANTPKQREVMKAVFACISEGFEPSARSIHARVSYGPDVTVHAIISSVKFLVKHGMLMPGEGKKWSRSTGGSTFVPTPMAYRVFKS